MLHFVATLFSTVVPTATSVPSGGADIVPSMFRDPVWQFVGAVLALAVPFMIYRITAPRRRLVWGIQSNAKLLSSSIDMRPGLQLHFNREPIENARLILLTFASEGNRAIRPEDFTGHIGIRAVGSLRILDADAIEFRPADLPLHFTSTSDEIAIEPLLLNPGDGFAVRMLIEGESASPRVLARIADTVVSATGDRKADRARILLGVAALGNIMTVFIAVVSVAPWAKTRIPALGIIVTIAMVVSALIIQLHVTVELDRLAARKK